MHKAGKKRPLKECLGENSNCNELRHKRRRFDNIVLLREGSGSQNNGNSLDRRYYDDDEVVNNSSRRILRAGRKRKEPDQGDIAEPSTSTSPTLNPQSEKTPDENDIINELTKEFKKARLRPVFFTISSFIEQTVDEVGFTMADEPETEITVRLTLPKRMESSADDGTGTSITNDNVEKEGASILTNSDSQSLNEKESNLIDNHGERNINLKLYNDTIEKTSSAKSSFLSTTDFIENAQEEISFI